MSKAVKRDIPALIALAKHADKWINERQKDFDFLSGVLDKLDRGQTVPKRERQRARGALKRLQQ